MQACHRMLGGPGLELGLLVAKEASRQLPLQPTHVSIICCALLCMQIIHAALPAEQLSSFSNTVSHALASS